MANKVFDSYIIATDTNKIEGAARTLGTIKLTRIICL